MTTLAGNLAYVSLLSLVPLIAVVFALFAAFPMFSDVSIQLRHFIFANFMPATGDVIQRYIEQFVANSNKMTAVGACGLIVTALLLMYAIDSALNTIWRSKRTRPKVYSFAVYWMILTLGPLLAGVSLAIRLLPAFFTLGQRSEYGHRQCIAHPSAAALVDLILVTLQYCPNDSRTEP
ncbi:ribonuclease BN [Salmonella enterica subsp. enterica serovar Typhimurium]|nr:ribonuclease BN [Salmonella enterica subsp. enterica serovar Typhimurium]